MQKTPSWDLSDLFSSIEDPKIEKSITETAKKATAFREKYRSKLVDFATPTALVGIMKEYEDILSTAVLPLAYGELVFSADSISPEKGAFLQKVRIAVTEIFSQLIFVELEITDFSEKIFGDLLASNELENYKHFFEKLLDWKKHRLSEKEEQVIEMKELTGKQAFTRLFEQELARQKFVIEIDGSEKELSQSEILNLLHTSDDQAIRRKASEIFTSELLQKESVIVFVFNTLMADKKISDKLHRFSFPEQARHLSNEAKREAVESMAKAVEENYSLVRQYYDFKRQVLGLEKLFDYDRYAPIAASDQQYTFAEAQEIVLNAFGAFDFVFGEIAEKIFAKSWIDAAPIKGKRGGAYCECATPEMHPYVFMNFTGSASDVITLAHEMGHAVNFELARKQTFVNFNSPLTLAETASTFAETLVFKRLVEKTKDKKILLGLYMQKIEGIFASVHRQIALYRFEQDFHRIYREKGELSRSEISEIWRERQSKMFGDSIKITDGYDNWWMYISHFVHTPFYVYAYSFGELLALGLFEKMENDQQNFVEKYKLFLEAAGTQSPEQLASIFGIDLEDPNFWKGGLKIIAGYLDEARLLFSQQ